MTDHPERASAADVPATVRIGWDFPLLLSGVEEGHASGDQELFRGHGYLEHLARETIQNSLDARGCGGPVTVVFELAEIESNAPFLRAYAHILGLVRSYQSGLRGYEGGATRRFVDEAEEMLGRLCVPCLLVRDYGTTGASGEAWRALAHSRGRSLDKREGGGSFGIGKAAAEASSALSLVLYSSKALDGSRLFEGTARLATFVGDDGRKRVAEGHYLKVTERAGDVEAASLTPEDHDPLEERFRRDEVGTDVIVVGFRKPRHFVRELARAVVKSALVALHDGRLEVVVKGDGEECRVNALTLPEVLAGLDDREMAPFREWYACLVSPDEEYGLSFDEGGSVVEPDAEHPSRPLAEADALVRLSFGPDLSNQVGFFKRNGMFLCRQSYSREEPHTAVVELRGREVSDLLLESENPSHKSWDVMRIHDRGLRRRARAIIRAFRTSVLESVSDHAAEGSGEEMDSGETVFSDAQPSLRKGVADLFLGLGESFREILFPSVATRSSQRARAGRPGADDVGLGGDGDARPGLARAGRAADATRGGAAEGDGPRTSSPPSPATPDSLRQAPPGARTPGDGDVDDDGREPGEGRPQRVLEATVHVRYDPRSHDQWFVRLQPDRDSDHATLRLHHATSEGRGRPVEILDCKSSQVACRVRDGVIEMEGLRQGEVSELALQLRASRLSAFYAELRGV